MKSMPNYRVNDISKEHWIYIPKIQQMTEFIKTVMKDEIGYIHNFQLHFIQTELQGMSKPSFPIQLFYDESYRRAYIKYDIDWLTKQEQSWQTTYRQINTRLINIFEESFDVECYILGAPNFYKDPRIPQGVYETDKLLPVDCITFWRTFDERYKFICNHNQVVADKINFLKFGGTENQIEEFNKKVLEINKKYNFEMNNQEDVEKGFNEYATLYKEYFNKDLKKVEYSNNPNMVYIYLDAYYDKVIREEENIE